ncbi:MAG: cytochrome c biogenesis protein CcsA [Myxococcales bacterium]|nr:cytochrome c biogenesis protein CcsA [Myxococcales bacterium]
MARIDLARTPPLLSALAWACVLLSPLALYSAFVYAPSEARMGIVYRIFYFHMPCAQAMYVGFGVCAAASVLYLMKRDPRFDAIAVAGAELGMVFWTVTMILGPLWGRKSWGVYWVWDPRLTSTLLAGMVYVSYLVLRSSRHIGEVERRFAAGLGIVGALTIPLIKYSVQRWRGTHPTVISGEGGGLQGEMWHALIVCLVLVTLLCAALIWIRARFERTRQQVEELELIAAERGLLEEG